MTTSPARGEAREATDLTDAIQTRARHEKKVATQLQENGVVTFLPLIAQTRGWSDRRKVIQLPFFPPMRSFAWLPLWKRVSWCCRPGVWPLLSAGTVCVGTPIPDSEIDSMQMLLAQNVTCSLFPFLKVGQRVRIRGGCLDGVEGILVAKNSDRSLVVSIELIQRSVAIRIDGYDVEMI